MGKRDFDGAWMEPQIHNLEKMARITVLASLIRIPRINLSVLISQLNLIATIFTRMHCKVNGALHYDTQLCKLFSNCLSSRLRPIIIFLFKPIW